LPLPDRASYHPGWRPSDRRAVVRRRVVGPLRRSSTTCRPAARSILATRQVADRRAHRCWRGDHHRCVPGPPAGQPRKPSPPRRRTTPRRDGAGAPPERSGAWLRGNSGGWRLEGSGGWRLERSRGWRSGGSAAPSWARAPRRAAAERVRSRQGSRGVRRGIAPARVAGQTSTVARRRSADAAGRCRPAGPDGRSSGGPGPDDRRLRPGAGWRPDDLGPVGGENGTARWWGDPHVRQTSEPRPALCGSDAGVLRRRRRRRRTHVPHRITNACSLSRASFEQMFAWAGDIGYPEGA
jgi:hypothetical protein